MSWNRELRSNNEVDRPEIKDINEEMLNDVHTNMTSTTKEANSIISFTLKAVMTGILLEMASLPL